MIYLGKNKVPAIEGCEYFFVSGSGNGMTFVVLPGRRYKYTVGYQKGEVYTLRQGINFISYLIEPRSFKYYYEKLKG